MSVLAEVGHVVVWAVVFWVVGQALDWLKRKLVVSGDSGGNHERH